MNGGEPAVALSPCPILSIIFSLLQQRKQSHRSWCTAKQKKALSLDCCLPCSVRSAPWRPESLCQRTPVAIVSTTCVWWEVFYLCNDLPDAALWRRRSFLWLCLYPPLSQGKAGRWWRSGEAAAAAGDGGLGAHIDLCHFSVSLSLALHLFPALSLSSLHFTSLHITRTHTHQGLGKLHKAEAPRGGDVNLFPLQNRHCHQARTAIGSTTGQPASPNSPKLTLCKRYTNKTLTYS